jgi:hypothetical protein
MNQRSKNQRRRNSESIKKIVIRCDMHQRPVYEHEICQHYEIGAGSDHQKNCKTCKHSF